MLLKKGLTGKSVEKVQKDLIRLGFGEYLKPHDDDGVFGDDTTNAVKKAQAYYKIKVDGIVGPQTTNTLEKAKREAGKKGTRHFNISEFNSKDGAPMLESGMSSELILRLEVIRNHFGGRPITINSGYRSLSHNRNVGGASKSQHLYGRAADIVVEGVKPSDVYKFVDQSLFKNDGAKSYATFVHVDTRGYRSRW